MRASAWRQQSCQTPWTLERDAKSLVNRGTAETSSRGAREQLKVRSTGKQGQPSEAWAGLRGALGPRTVLSSTAASGGHSLERCCRLPVMSPDIPQRRVQFRGQLCGAGAARHILVLLDHLRSTASVTWAPPLQLGRAWDFCDPRARDVGRDQHPGSGSPT